MSRRPLHATFALALLMLLVAAASSRAEDGKPANAMAEQAAWDALLKFDRNWIDYTNAPNFGDPRWKLKMETLVHLAKVGPSAVPVLEQAANESSPWAQHTRTLAAEVLRIGRESPTVRDAWANYNLFQMDIAKEGKLAPDFALADASGQSYRLSACRGKKTVVVSFIIQDI